MTHVTRKDFYGFRMLIQELEQKTSQYEVMNRKLSAPATSIISSMPKSQNQTNRLEYLLNKRMDLSKKIDLLKVKITQERETLDKAMEILNVSERTVLESRYFLLYSWDEIAGVIFESFKDFKENYEDYLQKTRLIQTYTFKKIEGKDVRKTN